MLNDVEFCLFFLLVSTTCRTSRRSAVTTLWMISLKWYFCEMWIRCLLYPVRNDQNLFRFHLPVELYSLSCLRLLDQPFFNDVSCWRTSSGLWIVFPFFSCIWSAMTENYLNALEFSFFFVVIALEDQLPTVFSTELRVVDRSHQ